MDIFITIILIALCIIAVSMGVILFAPRKKQNGVHISVDDSRNVKIIHAEDGVHLDIIFQPTEERDVEIDFDANPELLNTATNEGTPDKEFWEDVCRLDKLPVQRRETILLTLKRLGYIDDEHMINALTSNDLFDEPESVVDQNIDYSELVAKTEAAIMEEQTPSDNDVDGSPAPASGPVANESDAKNTPVNDSNIEDGLLSDEEILEIEL